MRFLPRSEGYADNNDNDSRRLGGTTVPKAAKIGRPVELGSSDRAQSRRRYVHFTWSLPRSRMKREIEDAPEYDEATDSDEEFRTRFANHYANR
jgi:hypothetical protein